MSRFLVEAYASNRGSLDPTEAIVRLQAAAEKLTAAGLHVHYVRSILVPDDETHFHLFESPSIDAVEEVGRRAKLTFDRVTEALEPVLTGEE